MQTTLLGLAIAFILALLAALIGPYFVDWNQFRPQFEAEATKVIGVPVRVSGQLDARLLPTPTLHLRSVTLGGNNDWARLRADKLDVELSLASLMRGEVRATELTVNGLGADIGLDSQGRIDLPSTNGTLNLASLAIDRLNVTGRIALHDAASRKTLELNDLGFSGDVRSLAGSVRGDGNFTVADVRYPFRVTSGPSADGSATRVHLTIDAAERPVMADLEGVLSFAARVPHFDGALTMAAPAPKQKPGVAAESSWKVTAKIKADPQLARLDQVEGSYGAEESAFRVTGAGDLHFGRTPLLRASLSARQLDADRLLSKDKSDSLRVLPALRAGLAAIPEAPIPAILDFSCEQITLGGRPLQNIAATFRTDGQNWTFQRLDLRAPGNTQITLSDAAARGADGFNGRLGLESSDPDTLVAWLQGRSEVLSRSAKPVQLSGDVAVASNHISIDRMRAEIEGGTVEGRIAFAQTTANTGSRVEANLKADRLDLDGAAALIRSLAGPQGEWPEAASLSLDVGQAMSSGQELRPFVARLNYDPQSFVLDQLKLGQSGGLTLEGDANINRANLQGRVALNATAATLAPVTALVSPLAPWLAERLNALGEASGPARASLALDLGKGKDALGAARAQLEFDLPQFKGQVVLTSAPQIAALRGLELGALARTDVTAQTNLSTDRGNLLLAVLGLDRVIAAGEGPARLEATAAGAWDRPLHASAKLTGNGLEGAAQGTMQVMREQSKADLDLRMRRVNLAPLFGIPASGISQTMSLSSHVVLADNRLTFNDLDCAAAGSRLRGRLAMSFGEQRMVEGEIGLDTLDLPAAFGVAIGATGHEAAEPLAAGLSRGWRGGITFQALRALLPGGIELRPFSGSIKSDGVSLSLDQLKGKLGGGEASASIDARNGGGGLTLNARLQLNNVDSAVLKYRSLAMPKARAGLQLALTSEGRSAAALTSALSGNGTLALEGLEIPGFDPRAFDVGIRASDSGQATDDARLRQIIEPVLASGKLTVGSAQIPFTIRDGRLRVSATSLDANNARIIVSGGYDLPADQADYRASLVPASFGSTSSPPEIQIFAAGSPDAMNRTVDVTSFSSWLAVRAIDRETRRLDAIERGETPATATLPSPAAVKPRLPAARSAPPAAAAAPASPLASGAAAPLPAPIEVKPPPGAAPRPVHPRPRPPLVLTPANPPN